MNSNKYSAIIEKYAMKLPQVAVVLFLCFFDVRKFGGVFSGEPDPVFYFCYAFFFLGLIVIFEIMEKGALTIPGSVIMALVLIFISRDRMLTVNVVTALISVFFTLLILQRKSEKTGFIIFLIFVVGNAVLFAIFGVDEKPAVLSVLVGVFYCMAHFAGKDADFRVMVTLSFFLILLLPVRNEPIKWTVIRNACIKVSDLADDLIDETGYRLSFFAGDKNAFSGYSEFALLGGTLSKKAKEDLLFIKNGGVKTLYLKGAEYSIITEDGMTGKENISEDYNDWFVVFINALMNSDITPEEARCFVKVESATVKYAFLRTEDLIYPSNLLYIDPKLENGLSEKEGKGFSYRVQYMAIDSASPYYKKLLENAGAGRLYDYDEVSQYTHDTLRIGVSKFMSREKYDRVVQRIIDSSYPDKQASYLDTAMSTGKINELCSEVTAGCDNDYEKAKAIEKYLRSYKYEMNTDLRDRDNYIEAFLFDTKEGYCVHFASAMVLLLRDAGIPARYVSGYIYNGDDEYVMSSSAHAWAEAYIDGIGWMTFEPTAIMNSAEDNTWGLTVKEEGVTQEYIPDIATEERLPDEVNPADESREKKQGIDKKLIKNILLYVAVIAGSFALLLLLVLIIRKLHFYMLPPEKKLYEIVRKACLDIEKRIKNKEEVNALRSNTSSLYDYLKYVESPDEKIRLNKMFDLYYRVRFRGDKVSREEISVILGK